MGRKSDQLETVQMTGVGFLKVIVYSQIKSYLESKQYKIPCNFKI